MASQMTVNNTKMDNYVISARSKSESACKLINIIQGSHKLWKSWNITKKSSMHEKIMEFEKNTLNNHREIMEFCEII